MKRIIFLTAVAAVAIMTSTASYGQNAEKQVTTESKITGGYIFDGKLGGTDIRLLIDISEDGNTVKGNYCYCKYDTKIQLEGVMNGDQIELTEFLEGKPNGYFQGRIFTDNAPRFEGTWANAEKTKQLDVKTRSSIGGGGSYTLDKFYDYYGTNEEIEGFMKKVKQSIANGNKEWLSAHINYPLKVKLNGQKDMTIKNKQQFIDNFDQIFYPAYKEKIKKLCVCYMDYNWRGIMLGNGHIWTDGKTIMSVNNGNEMVND